MLTVHYGTVCRSCTPHFAPIPFFFGWPRPQEPTPKESSKGVYFWDQPLETSRNENTNELANWKALKCGVVTTGDTRLPFFSLLFIIPVKTLFRTVITNKFLCHIRLALFSLFSLFTLYRFQPISVSSGRRKGKRNVTELTAAADEWYTQKKKWFV